MKKCPFCAEDIQDAAIKCKHCGEMLSAPEKLPWYYSTGSLVISFFCVGPFMLPLIWRHPKLSRNQKAASTTIIAAVTLALTWGMWWAAGKIGEYYKMLGAF